MHWHCIRSHAVIIDMNQEHKVGVSEKEHGIVGVNKVVVYRFSASRCYSRLNQIGMTHEISDAF